MGVRFYSLPEAGGDGPEGPYKKKEAYRCDGKHLPDKYFDEMSLESHRKFNKRLDAYLAKKGLGRANIKDVIRNSYKND